MTSIHFGRKLMSHDKSKGYTIIELLVVIAVISILVGAGVISYVKYIKYAKDTIMDSNRAEFMNNIQIRLSSPSTPGGYKDCYSLINDLIDSFNKNAINVYTKSDLAPVWINGHNDLLLNKETGVVGFLQGEQLVICQDPKAAANATDIAVCSCKDSYCSTKDATTFLASPQNSCPNPRVY